MASIIALTGKRGSGKSTLARYITHVCAERELPCVTFSFATPLKMACHIMFGGDTSHWFGNKKEEILPHLGKTPRELMQKLGTEFVRDKVDELMWVKMMQANIEQASKSLESCVILIDDLRFGNEAVAIREAGGTIFKICLDTMEDVVTEDPNVHRSERGVANEHIDTIYTCVKGDHPSLKNIASRILKSQVV
jgi:energy-coupling factor transporter ATP-binding protein EcfA2